MSVPVDGETQRTIELAARAGSNRAAAALAELMGRPLHSATFVSPAQPLARGSGIEGSVPAFEVEGSPDSRFVVTFPLGTLEAVRGIVAPGSTAEMMPDESIAFEIGNICTSHFLNALGDMLGSPLVPTPPHASTPGELEAIAKADDEVVIHSEFASREGGQFGLNMRFHLGQLLLKRVAEVPAGAR